MIQPVTRVADRPSHVDRLVSFGVAIVASLVAAWASQPYLVGVFHDDGVYVLLARALATGGGLHYTFLPGFPAATHYPPIYPFALSLIWRANPEFPENVASLLRFNALLLGAAAAGAYWCLRRQAGFHTAAAAGLALLVTLCLPTLALASALLSETLFLALLWPSLALCDRARTRSSVGSDVTAASVISILTLVRTQGVALLAALILALLLENRPKSAVRVAGVFLVLQAPWLVWSSVAQPHLPMPLQGSYGSYLAWFADGARGGGFPFLVSTIAVNTRETLLYLQDRLVLGSSQLISRAALVVAVAAVVAGALSLWSKWKVTALFLPVYLAIVLVWPYTPWRFLWGIWPVLFAVAAIGVRSIATLRTPVRYSGILAMIPFAALLRVELHAYRTRDWRSAAAAGAAQIAPALDWTRLHTQRDDVVLGEGEQLFALYQNRIAAPPVSFTAEEYLRPPDGGAAARRLGEMLRAIPAKYAILLNPVMIAAARSLSGVHPGLREIEQLRSGVVFEVLR